MANETPEESLHIREQALAAAARVYEGGAAHNNTAHAFNIVSLAISFENYLRGHR